MSLVRALPGLLYSDDTLARCGAALYELMAAPLDPSPSPTAGMGGTGRAEPALAAEAGSSGSQALPPWAAVSLATQAPAVVPLPAHARDLLLGCGADLLRPPLAAMLLPPPPAAPSHLAIASAAPGQAQGDSPPAPAAARSGPTSRARSALPGLMSALHVDREVAARLVLGTRGEAVLLLEELQHGGGPTATPAAVAAAADSVGAGAGAGSPLQRVRQAARLVRRGRLWARELDGYVRGAGSGSGGAAELAVLLRQWRRAGRLEALVAADKADVLSFKVALEMPEAEWGPLAAGLGLGLGLAGGVEEAGAGAAAAAVSGTGAGGAPAAAVAGGGRPSGWGEASGRPRGGGGLDGELHQSDDARGRRRATGAARPAAEPGTAGAPMQQQLAEGFAVDQLPSFEQVGTMGARADAVHTALQAPLGQGPPGFSGHGAADDGGSFKGKAKPFIIKRKR